MTVFSETYTDAYLHSACSLLYTLQPVPSHGPHYDFRIGIKKWSRLDPIARFVAEMNRSVCPLVVRQVVRDRM